MTKLDGTSKGGALVSIYETQIAHRLYRSRRITGDLQPFSIDLYLDSILPERAVDAAKITN